MSSPQSQEASPGDEDDAGGSRLSAGSIAGIIAGVTSAIFAIGAAFLLFLYRGRQRNACGTVRKESSASDEHKG